MTTIEVDVSSVRGGRPDGVVIIAATPDRAGGTGWVSGAEVEVPLVAGLATLTDVEPGPARITIRTDRTAEVDHWAQSWRVIVPAEDCRLEDLVEGQVEWPAPVIGQAQQLRNEAREARDEARVARDDALGAVVDLDAAIADAAGQIVTQVQGSVDEAAGHASDAATAAGGAETARAAAVIAAGTAANRVENLGGLAAHRALSQAAWDILTPAEKARAATLTVVF